MDRSLDDSIMERQRSSNRDRRPPPRRNDYPRDGVRKSTRDERTNLENDWVHDRYDDDDRTAKFESARNNRNRSRRDDYEDRKVPDVVVRAPSSAKLRVENLHYDITEDELYDLFERIAPVESVKLVYDRAGRSNGTAFIIFPYIADAKSAIREFDGANAKGQPIRLELLPPSAPGGGRSEPRARRDNPFDRVENPRSLFDRVEAPKGREGRARSASPGAERGQGGRRAGGGGRGPTSRERRSDVTRPAPDGIDRYVPSQNGGRSSSHRGGYGGRESGRRPGERRERAGGRDSKDTEGHKLVNGRPRKTQEELDAEMEDYWGSAGNVDATVPAPAINGAVGGGAVTAQAAATAVGDDDMDMID